MIIGVILAASVGMGFVNECKAARWLTEGSLCFMQSAGPNGVAGDGPLLLGLPCNEAVVEGRRTAYGNPLDVALQETPATARQQAALGRYRRLATVPFDHKRRLVSVPTEDDRGHRMIITKGARRACSVDSVTDVAKDAADVLLPEKDLDVLADGVMDGRRIFANTMKYVLMSTSSNFGNMFGVAGA